MLTTSELFRNGLSSVLLLVATGCGQTTSYPYIGNGAGNGAGQNNGNNTINYGPNPTINDLMPLYEYSNVVSDVACSYAVLRCYDGPIKGYTPPAQWWNNPNAIPTCTPLIGGSPPIPDQVAALGLQRLTKAQADEVSAWAFNCFGNPNSSGYSEDAQTFLNTLAGMTVPTPTSADPQASTPCVQYPLFGIVDSQGNRSVAGCNPPLDRHASCSSMPLNCGFIGSAIPSA